MGVYIKEMEMPPSCGFCRLAWCCKASEGEAVDLRMRNSNRHPNCPLVEVKTPHGRLIDETKIDYVYGEVDYLKVNYTGYTSRVEFISGTDAPTVIEAEVE